MLERIKDHFGILEERQIQNGTCIKILDNDKFLKKLQKKVTKKDKLVFSKEIREISKEFPQDNVIIGKKIVKYMLKDIIEYCLQNTKRRK